MVGSFSSPRFEERNGSWAQLATQNGRVCHCEFCWSGPSWKTMRAKSCWKELIAARRRKSPYHTSGSDLLCPQRAPGEGSSAGSLDCVPDEWA
jgi:hypothetical protein